MSAFTKLHDVVARVFGIGKADAEAFVTALTDHIKPLFAEVKVDEAKLAQTVADAVKVDYEKIAAEVAKVLAHQAPAASAPAPATPPAGS